MNEESKKLKNIRTSCKAAKIVSRIILIALIVAAVLSIVSGIVLLANRKNMDEKILQAAASGQKINVDMKFGPFVFGRFVDGEFIATEKIDSDVPALKAYFEENADSPSLFLGFYITLMSSVFIVSAVAFFFITSVFDIVVKEGNPFTGKVIKRTLIAMIILTLIVGSNGGLGFGILMGFLTWVIYTILDYGRVLQIQSDETL